MLRIMLYSIAWRSVEVLSNSTSFFPILFYCIAVYYQMFKTLLELDHCISSHKLQYAAKRKVFRDLHNETSQKADSPCLGGNNAQRSKVAFRKKAEPKDAVSVCNQHSL